MLIMPIHFCYFCRNHFGFNVLPLDFVRLLISVQSFEIDYFVRQVLCFPNFFFELGNALYLQEIQIFHINHFSCLFSFINVTVLIYRRINFLYYFEICSFVTFIWHLKCIHGSNISRFHIALHMLILFRFMELKNFSHFVHFFIFVKFRVIFHQNPGVSKISRLLSDLGIIVHAWSTPDSYIWDFHLTEQVGLGAHRDIAHPLCLDIAGFGPSITTVYTSKGVLPDVG